MTKVLQTIDNGANSGFASWGPGGVTTYTDTWITSDFLIDTALATYLKANVNTYVSIIATRPTGSLSDNLAVFSSGYDRLDVVSLDGTTLSIAEDGATAAGWGTLAPLTWHTVEWHQKKVGGVYTLEVFLDGVSVGAITPTGLTWNNYVNFSWGDGANGVPPGATSMYFRNIKVGTTRGANDIFDMGTLTTTVVPPFSHAFSEGSFTLVADDPSGGGGGGDTTGVLISDSAALATDPVFTRLDNRKGVNVATITVKRGRPDERSKCTVGTATLNGFDTVGDTDPTNSGSPLITMLDPVQPAQVNLYNPVDKVWSPIFTGYTADWTHDLDVSEKKLDFQLDLVDMLDMLNDAEIVPDQAGNTVPGESVGDVFYTGQHVDDRLRAVLADASTAFLAQVWPTALMNIFTGNVNVQGRIYANRTSLLQVIDEACDAEFPGVSNRFIDKTGVFDFRGRYARYNPGTYIAGSGNANTARAPSTPGLQWYVGDQAAATVDNTLAIYTALKFTRGKANLINAALVTPIGIKQSDISGQFVFDSISVGLYGPRTSGMSLENIITGDANDDGLDALPETKAMGQGTVDNYKDPVNHVSQLVFRNPPAGASGTRAASTWRLLCNVELSDLITITSHHPGGGGFTAVDHFVEGITYSIRPLKGDEWDVTLTLDVSPRAYYTTNPFPHS